MKSGLVNHKSAETHADVKQKRESRTESTVSNQRPDSIVLSNLIATINVSPRVQQLNQLSPDVIWLNCFTANKTLIL